MKTNIDESYISLSGINKLTVNIDEKVEETEDNQILLGIIADSNLSLKISTIYVTKPAQRIMLLEEYQVI